MTRRTRFATALAVVLILFVRAAVSAWPVSRSVAAPGETPEGIRRRLSESYGNLPLTFEANRGQTDERIRFLSRGSGYTLFLTSDEAVRQRAPPPIRDLARA